jgi:hypothetical protein
LHLTPFLAQGFREGMPNAVERLPTIALTLSVRVSTLTGMVAHLEPETASRLRQLVTDGEGAFGWFRRKSENRRRL